MKIKKNGSVIYNSIDNTGSTDDASLGSRYAKGRLDSTDTNLRQNYYTKEEVQELISGMGRTKIVPTLFEDWYIYVPEEEATEEEIYYHVNNNTVISEPNLDDLPTYYRQWKVEDSEVVPVSWFISCANDTEIVAGQTYYTIGLFGPTTKSTIMNNYVKAKIQVENNTYYFVGNDDDGYVLYYYDADFKEAIIGNFEIDFSQYALKETTIGSYTLENNITAQNIQDDIKDLTTTLTNKTIDADDNTVENIEVDNFKTGVVKTAMPASPADTELLSAKAIDEAKQDKLTAGAAITTVEDSTTVSQIDLANKKNFPVSALNIWNYIKSKFASDSIDEVSDTTKIGSIDNSKANVIQETTAQAMFEYIANKIYPVGSIYTTITQDDPATLFGGTWEIVSSERYLRGVASTTNAGTLVEEQLPNVKGQVSFSAGAQGHPELSSASGAIQTGSAGTLTYPEPAGTSGGPRILKIDASKQTNSVYKDNGNVIPSSYTVHFWKRTA